MSRLLTSCPVKMANSQWIVFCSIFAISFANYYYKTNYIDLDVDHFSYGPTTQFKLRYLINDTYWKEGKPIFFYTGNEGDIETFAANTGFMWEIAPEFKAMVVFAEHRYYGQTMPFGNKSFTGPEYLRYLTSTQALADYVTLLDDLKDKYKAHKSPVIAFGGSYGGMLAAWIRLKYPSSVFAAVSSSAPVFQFSNLTPCGSYFKIVSNVFKISAPKGVCAANIKKSWAELKNITSSADGRAWLSKEWNTCKPVGDGDYPNIVDWLKEVYGNLAMVNYPYPTNFLAELPGYPIKETCAHLVNKTLSGKPLLTSLKKALSIYTNYTGKAKCLDLNQSASSAIGDQGWNFQACTEMVMPICNDDNEMFEKDSWDLKGFQADCKKKFGVAFERDDDAIREYGGKPAPYTNVVFTNGLLDPWSAGGNLNPTGNSAYAIIIPNAAHHLDLRASNPMDPPTVVGARRDITNVLKAWIKLYNENQ